MNNEDQILTVLGMLSLSELESFFGTSDIEQGVALFEAGKVYDVGMLMPASGEVGLQGWVQDGPTTYRAGLVIKSESQVYLACECAMSGLCAHAVAVILAARYNFLGISDFRDLTDDWDDDDDLWDVDDNLWVEEVQRPDIPGGGVGIPEAGRANAPLTRVPEHPEKLRDWLLAPEASKEATSDPNQILTRFLSMRKIADLRALGKRHGFKPRGTRKDDIVEQLVQFLREAVRRPDFLAGLNDKEARVLRGLYTAYGIRPTLTQNEIRWLEKSLDLSGEEIRKAVSGLQEYGLLYHCHAHGQHPHYHWLPGLEDVALPVEAYSIQEARRSRLRAWEESGEAPPLPVNLAKLVAFLQHHRLALPPRRRQHPGLLRYYPGMTEWEYDYDEINQLIGGSRFRYYGFTSGTLLTVLAPQSPLPEKEGEELVSLLGGDREYVGWLMELARAAQILTTKDGKPPVWGINLDVWQLWYHKALQEQLQLVLDLWRKGNLSWSEMRLVQQYAPQLRIKRVMRLQTAISPSDLAREFTQARGFVTRLIQDLPAGVWYDWGSFLDRVWRLDSQFLHTYYGTDFWGLSLKGQKIVDPENHHVWRRTYGQILRAFFEGPLRWLGVVEVGTRGKDLQAFRLTQTGVWLLRGEGQPPTLIPQAECAQTLAWLDETRIRVLPGPHTAPVIPMLIRLARPASEAYVFELTEEGIQEVFTQGITPPAIFERFETADAPLPASTRQRIEQLWECFGHVHLYEGITVLELADDFALKELLANSELRKHIIHQFSPRLVVVEDQAVDAMVETLVKKGYTPKVEEGQ